jgi:urease accessory protein
MYAAFSQSKDDATTINKIIVDGKARLSFAASEGVTRLEDLFQSDPVRILFPSPPKDDISQAVVVTTSGGLVGGDKIALDIAVRENAKALVTAQSAEKIYRSAGEDARINVSLNAAPGSWLEYLPQETILFNGSRLQRQTTIDVAEGGQLLAGEMMVFGRLGHGERFEAGLAHEAWEISKDGRLVWGDALHLEDNIADVLDDPACFDDAVATATAVYIGPNAEHHLTTVRDILSDQESATLKGVTFVNGILVMRWLGKDALDLRNDFGSFWGRFRNQLAGLPTTLPRLWNM